MALCTAIKVRQCNSIRIIYIYRTRVRYTVLVVHVNNRFTCLDMCVHISLESFLLAESVYKWKRGWAWLMHGRLYNLHDKCYVEP